MNERDQILYNAVVAIFGVTRVAMFEKLLKAAESRNDVVGVVQSAISSRIRSETDRLEGKVLTRMERQGLDSKTRDKVKFALGIGGRSNTPSFDEVIANEAQ